MFTEFIMLSAMAAASPDLVLRSVTAENLSSSDQVTLTAVVENIGLTSSSPSRLDVLSTPDWEHCEGMVWNSQEQPALAPGEQVTLQIVLPTRQMIGSPVHLFLDLQNGVEESDERNNEGVVYLMSTSAPQPEHRSTWTWWQHSECLQEQTRAMTQADIGVSRKVRYSRLKLL